MSVNPRFLQSGPMEEEPSYLPTVSQNIRDLSGKDQERCRTLSTLKKEAQNSLDFQHFVLLY